MSHIFPQINELMGQFQGFDQLKKMLGFKQPVMPTAMPISPQGLKPSTGLFPMSGKQSGMPTIPMGFPSGGNAAMIPSINFKDGMSGVKNNGKNSMSVGISGLDQAKQLAAQIQQQFNSLIPGVGQMTPSDLAAAKAYSDYVFNQGKQTLDATLDRNIGNFREDLVKRGLGASSSMLNGMQNLFNSNAMALADLQNKSGESGLKYAWDLANMRTNAAGSLNQMNSDLYKQINQIPLEMAAKFAVPQAQMQDAAANRAMENVFNYYQQLNNNISKENEASAKLASTLLGFLPKMFYKVLPTAMK